MRSTSLARVVFVLIALLLAQAAVADPSGAVLDVATLTERADLSGHLTAYRDEGGNLSLDTLDARPIDLSTLLREV